MELEIQANAKINLALDVIGQRPDGYHEIDTIMQEISLGDLITIEPGRGGLVLFSDDPSLDLGPANLVYQAWELLKDQAEDDAVVIDIQKRIPMAGGLGGGSADAAATLRGLNTLWKLHHTEEELEEIAAKLGSDVPFFIRGGTQRARGRGEKLTTLKSCEGKHLLLLNSGDSLSSRLVYNTAKIKTEMYMEGLTHYLATDSPRSYTLMKNELESAAISLLPHLQQMKEELIQAGALTAMVSGSGPTVFGLFETDQEMERAKAHFTGRYPFVKGARTL